MRAPKSAPPQLSLSIIPGFFAFYQEAQVDSVMAGFKALTPSRANVLRDGQVIEIDAGELVVGDVVKGAFVDRFAPTQSRNLVSVSFGEKVPADVRIIDAVNLKARSVPNFGALSCDAMGDQVDNSSLTGEPEPLRRVPEKTDDRYSSPPQSHQRCSNSIPDTF